MAVSAAVAAFLAHLPPARATSIDQQALASAIRKMWDAGRAAWPRVILAEEDFAQHVAERLPDDIDPIHACALTHAADLYLACACSRGEGLALAAFEQHFVQSLSDYLDRRDSLPGFTEEVKQAVRTRLLVTDDGLVPRIAGYSGRGPLMGWLRVAAARAAIDLQRARRPDLPLKSADLLLPDGGPDPELAVLQRRHLTDLREALAATLEALDDAEATLLRLHFLDGVPVEGIAEMYGIAARTVRWRLARARSGILEQTRRRLAERLQLTNDDADSLLHLLDQQLGSSIIEILDPH